MHRIERDDGAVSDTEFGEQGLSRRNLVGLLGDVDMCEHEGGVGGECAEHLGGGAVVEVVEAAAQRLTVQRDAAVSRRRACRLQQSGMAAEDRFHIGRIEPFEDVADGCVRGRAAPFQTEGDIQPVAMDVDEGDDAAIRGNRQPTAAALVIPCCP